MSVSAMPSRSEAAAPGWLALELAGERLSLLERAVVVVSAHARAQPALDQVAVAFGEVVEHVALLVHGCSAGPGCARRARR